MFNEESLRRCVSVMTYLCWYGYRPSPELWGTAIVFRLKAAPVPYFEAPSQDREAGIV